MKKCRNSLKRLRQEKNVTLQQISDETGISLASISAFENGMRPMPDHKLKKILQILQCEMSDLIGANADDPEAGSDPAMASGSGGDIATRLEAREHGMRECKTVCEKTNELLMTIQNTLLQLLAAGRSSADKGVGDSAGRRAG